MATIPVFRTWVAGEIVTAAFLNANVRDAGNFFLSWPVAELRQTVAQSIANGGTGAALLFDVEDIDTDNGHSTVTNTSRYTGQTAGRFQLSGASHLAANVTGRRGCWWRLNAADVAASMSLGPASAAFDMASVSRVRTIVLNGSTDYVELVAYQESGGALLTTVTSASGGQSSMSVRMVGTV